MALSWSRGTEENGELSVGQLVRCDRREGTAVCGHVGQKRSNGYQSVMRRESCHSVTWDRSKGEEQSRGDGLSVSRSGGTEKK